MAYSKRIYAYVLFLKINLFEIIVAKSRIILYIKMSILLILIVHLEFNVIGSERPLIYILLWDQVPVFENTPGQQYFINQNCSYQNCFLTVNRSLFHNVTDFEVILFNVFQVSVNPPRLVIPDVRSPEQKYILMSSEPPTMYPVSPLFNGFFNYTFTYKLDSDITWRFFVVRNKTDNKVITPKKDVQWMDINDMEPISADIKRKLKNKSRLVVWLVSHCETPNKREDYVNRLRNYLVDLYNISIDITGRWRCVDPYQNEVSPCNYWHKTHGNYSQEVCHRWISDNHYFYLAFENSICEDYVTEKILTATKNFAIPVVLGGANYSR